MGLEASRIRNFFLKGSNEHVLRATRALALHALSGVVMRTPVDTGRARGNWQVSLGAPSGQEINNLDKGGGATLAAGSNAIAAARAFQVIVLENNVPYIGRLNDGSSKQAPAGYVEATLAGLGLGTGRE